ncbi:MAG: 4Fe-4S dicluster domain-containing protein [Dehalobacterium sp.]
MSRRVLVAEAKKCIGCRICEQWCSLAHEGVVNPAKTRIKIFKSEETGNNVPIICTQCKKPACIAACPEDALSKDEKTGAIKIDKAKCTACRKCITACPNGAISMHPEEEYALICNLCHGKPKCVENCPEKAVQYLPIEQSERIHRSIIGRKAEGGKVHG